MAITKEDVRKVAGLARLDPTDIDIELYTEQLSKILSHVEEISKLDTKGVEPTRHAVPIKGPMREDVATGSLPQVDALLNAPSSENGCFKVPKIIE